MTTSAVSATTSADQAFGLSFQSLLQIILTQLTYQDPLHPLDNYQFVSQLAQFSQLQLTETLDNNVQQLLATQAASQAIGLLGHTVDLTTGTSSSASTETGTVQAVTFSSGQPELTVAIAGGQVIPNVQLSSIVQVR